ncbi:S1 family peptidase [Xanthomonas citri]|uniref:S1 family peptidase n=1 Tax=Xanthomonas citri TaxID=346 RepID=UPI001C042890|nr:S1 family peptidase [Xanthomonas citri]QWN07018.1 peptidase [Xanthomonas citri pv. fuscans]
MKKLFKLVFLSFGLVSFNSMAKVRNVTAESDEAKAYSKSAMISTAEAARRINIQESSENDIAALTRQYSGRLAGAYWEESPEFRFVIRLKGSEKVSLAKISTSFGEVPVVIRSGASKTSEEVRQIINSNQDVLFKSVPGLQGSFYDEKTGQIVLNVYVPESEKADIKREIPALDKALGNPVRIDFMPGSLREAASYLRGGNILQGSNGNQCTSGFMVRETATKILGVLTAGHCPDNMIYYNWVPAGQSGQIVAILDFKKEMYDAGHDLQWHSYPVVGYTASSSITGSTVYSTGLQAIQSSGTASVGTRLCHRGVNTGFSCGVVSTTSYTFPTKSCNDQYCDSTAYMAMVGDELACFGGDSGGPVWSGFTAYGIVKSAAFSGANPGQCGLLVYMRIGRILDAGLRLF